MELEFEKYCVVDGSPTTVLLSPRRFSRIENRKSERKPICVNDRPLKQNTNLKDITSCIYQSTSCNSGNNELLKRGSVYQSSKELREMRKTEISLLELDRTSFMSLGKQRIEETCSVSESISVVSSDGFLEISLDSFGPLNDGNELKEDDSSITMPNSPSDKLGQIHYSPSRSDCDWSESSPLANSKSQVSPLGSGTQHGVTKTVQKSLLGNFSNTWSAQCDPPMPCSPAHLHGLLKRGNKRGLPFFEFSVKLTEENFVAKMWKTENALNWAYTFHKKQSDNSTGWGFKDNSKESCPIAQMQVSCYLYTELNNNGAFDNSMVTEFVSYNTEQARRNRVTQDNWDHIELNPSLEIAAVVIKVPFEKRESLKCKRGDKNIDEPILNLGDLYNIDKRNKDFSNCINTAKVNVIIPLGSHGLPESESCRPSPLLDRWMYGGGCDCGGWDMGCPFLVSGNSNIRYNEEHLVVDNQQPLEIFIQGTKEKTPALSMSVIKEGQYAIDFHAKFSTLQAFSISVAILHSMQTTTSAEQETEKQLSRCDTLRGFMGDHEAAKCSLEVVAEEENLRKICKRMEEKPPPSFVLSPPFSPIARA